jgi:hypothetical protein
MGVKRVIIYTEKLDKETMRKIKAGVSRVLATYPKSLLAEVDENKIDSLKKLGIRLEMQEAARIKLRTIEFDPLKEIPSPPSALRLAAEEIKKEEKNYWIVQFIGPLKAEWREKIKSLGARLHTYIPENSILVYMTPATKKKVENLPFVNWVGLYEPAYKVSPFLMGRKKSVSPSELATLSIETKEFGPKPVGNLNIILHNSGDIRKISKELEKLGGTVITTGKDMIRTSLDLTKIDKLAKMVEVKWIEPYLLPELWNDVAAQIVGVQPVWNTHGLDGEGQIVAVADSGLDTGVNDATMHDDFEGRIVNIYSWQIPAGLHPLLDNASWDDGASDVDSGHGTHVAGSVLGSGANSGGAIRGMAFRARLVSQAIEQWADFKPPIDLLFPDGYYLFGIPGDLNDLFLQAYNDGARIHTNSWGDRLYGQYTALSQDIDEFTWKHKDMVILFAAGNAGQDADQNGVVDDDSLSSPACAKNCISVGASENNRAIGGYNPGGVCASYGACWPLYFPSNPLRDDPLSDNPDGLVAFSSRGPTNDGRIKPDVVAPGTNILSVRSSRAAGTGWGLLPAGDPNQPFYMYLGGTSQATPLAAGTVALIRQYLQRVCLLNPSAALVKAVLIHGAAPLAGQYANPEVGAAPDNNQGWGRVNLQNALFPDPPVKVEFRDNPADTLGTGDHKDFALKMTDSTVPFRATLVWTDFPSDPAVSGALVNSLRLSVILPDSSTQQGSPANNNVQQVAIQNPQTGAYTVRVEGTNIATQATTGDRQDFALVVSAGLEFIDLYLRDNPADQGIPPAAARLHSSPDIRVDVDTVRKKARVYVKVHNRGSKQANRAKVSLYWVKGTNLSPSNWKIEGIKVRGVAGNVQGLNVPARSAGRDGEATTGAFEITPPPQEILRPGRITLIATVGHPKDPIRAGLGRWDNNAAAKTF